jgi:hypothetical protein
MGTVGFRAPKQNATAPDRLIKDLPPPRPRRRGERRLAEVLEEMRSKERHQVFYLERAALLESKQLRSLDTQHLADAARAIGIRVLPPT